MRQVFGLVLSLLFLLPPELALSAGNRCGQQFANPPGEVYLVKFRKYTGLLPKWFREIPDPSKIFEFAESLGPNQVATIDTSQIGERVLIIRNEVYLFDFSTQMTLVEPNQWHRGARKHTLGREPFDLVDSAFKGKDVVQGLGQALTVPFRLFARRDFKGNILTMRSKDVDQLLKDLQSKRPLDFPSIHSVKIDPITFYASKEGRVSDALLVGAGAAAISFLIYALQMTADPKIKAQDPNKPIGGPVHSTPFDF